MTTRFITAAALTLGLFLARRRQSRLRPVSGIRVAGARHRWRVRARAAAAVLVAGHPARWRRCTTGGGHPGGRRYSGVDYYGGYYYRPCYGYYGYYGYPVRVLPVRVWPQRRFRLRLSAMATAALTGDTRTAWYAHWLARLRRVDCGGVRASSDAPRRTPRSTPTATTSAPWTISTAAFQQLNLEAGRSSHRSDRRQGAPSSAVDVNIQPGQTITCRAN